MLMKEWVIRGSKHVDGGFIITIKGNEVDTAIAIVYNLEVAEYIVVSHNHVLKLLKLFGKA
jgi:hypothetical protein